MKILVIIIITINIYSYSQDNLNIQPLLFNYNGNTNTILTEEGLDIDNPFIIGWQWGGDHRLFNIVILSILPVILSEAKNPVEISRSLSGAEMNIVFFWNLIFVLISSLRSE